MLHELQELEARVLKLDRAIQGFSLAKTVLPVIHRPGWATHVEIFAADEALDAMERKIGELTELMRKVATPSGVRGLPLGKGQPSTRPAAPKIATAQRQAVANF